MHIATQLIDRKEIEELSVVFDLVDENSDGKLSCEELEKWYSASEIENILSKINYNNDSYIDHSGFIAGSLDKKKLLSKENIRRVFELYDAQGSKYITSENLQSVLDKAKQFIENIWVEIMDQIVEAKAGKLTLELLELIMTFV